MQIARIGSVALVLAACIAATAAAAEEGGDFVRRMVSWGWGRRSHFPDARPSVAAFPFAPASADWWIAVEPLVLRDARADPIATAHSATDASGGERDPNAAALHAIGPIDAPKIAALRGGGSVNRDVVIGGGDDADDETPSRRTARAGTAHYIGRDAARAVREERERPLSVIIHNTAPASADWYRPRALELDDAERDSADTHSASDDANDEADTDTDTDRDRAERSAAQHTADAAEPARSGRARSEKADTKPKPEADTERVRDNSDRVHELERERPRDDRIHRMRMRLAASNSERSKQQRLPLRLLTVSFAVPRDGSAPAVRVRDGLDRRTLWALHRARGRGVTAANRALRRLRLVERGAEAIVVAPGVWALRGDAEPRFSVTAEAMGRGDGDGASAGGSGDGDGNGDVSSGTAAGAPAAATRIRITTAATPSESEGQIGRRSARDRDRSSDRDSGYLRRQVSWSWNAPTDDAPGGFVADAW